MWKNVKFSLTKKISRLINSLVIYLVKKLLSPNFLQKCVRGNSHNFHTEEHTVWKFEKISTSQILREIDFGVW